jgi:hypothetical protein
MGREVDLECGDTFYGIIAAVLALASVEYGCGILFTTETFG